MQRVLQLPGLKRLYWLARRNPGELERFVKFASVGAIGMLVDLTVLNALHILLGMEPLWANTISFSAAVVSNFTWNRLWTFPESRARPLLPQLTQFAIVNVVGLGINNLVLWASLLGFRQIAPDPLDVNLAKITAIGVVLFWNFGVNRVWTYRGIK